MRGAQWMLLLSALAVSLVLPALVDSLSSMLSPVDPPRTEVIKVNATGWRADAAALCVESLLGYPINISRAFRCFLFGENETPIVWLGRYDLRGIRAYGTRQNSIVLELKEGGGGEAYALIGLKAGSEVYALIERDGRPLFTPLLRIIEEEALIEITGTAKGAERVEAFAYAAAEDFNASQPPLRSVYVTESEVIDGKFVLRIEKRGAPLTPRGTPLLETNSTLVLYTGCSYSIVDLADYVSSPGSLKLSVNLDCWSAPSAQAP